MCVNEALQSGCRVPCWVFGAIGGGIAKVDPLLPNGWVALETFDPRDQLQVQRGMGGGTGVIGNGVREVIGSGVGSSVSAGAGARCGGVLGLEFLEFGAEVLQEMAASAGSTIQFLDVTDLSR